MLTDKQHVQDDTTQQRPTIESRWAITRVRGDGISAGPSIEARVVSAFVHVILAVLPLESVRTSAAVTIDEIGADSIVATRVGIAFVQVGLAVVADETYEENHIS